MLRDCVSVSSSLQSGCGGPVVLLGSVQFVGSIIKLILILSLFLLVQLLYLDLIPALLIQPGSGSVLQVLVFRSCLEILSCNILLCSPITLLSSILEAEVVDAMMDHIVKCLTQLSINWMTVRDL